MPGHAGRHYRVLCKMTEPRCRLGCGLVWDQGSMLRGVHIGANWRIRLNRPCVAAMRPFCQITLTTCYSLKGKGFPYWTPSVVPGADPGVQAVSL